MDLFDIPAWTNESTACLLDKIPLHIIFDHILPQLGIRDLFQFIYCFQSHPKYGPIFLKWLFLNPRTRKYLHEKMTAVSPLEFLENLQTLDVEKVSRKSKMVLKQQKKSKNAGYTTKKYGFGGRRNYMSGPDTMDELGHLHLNKLFDGDNGNGKQANEPEYEKINFYEYSMRFLAGIVLDHIFNQETKVSKLEKPEGENSTSSNEMHDDESSGRDPNEIIDLTLDSDEREEQNTPAAKEQKRKRMQLNQTNHYFEKPLNDPPVYGIWTKMPGQHQDRKISWTQKIFAQFLMEAPKKMGFIWVKEMKIILPDFYDMPILNDFENNHLYEYLREFKFDTVEGHRKACILGAFVLACLYSFNTTDIRIRVFSLNDYLPIHDYDYRHNTQFTEPRTATRIYVPQIETLHSPYPFQLTLPESVDMNNEEQYQDSSLWDNYASFEEESAWDLLVDDPKFSHKKIIANALCAKMDLASATYHSPTNKIEIFGLANTLAYSHFDKDHQLDWRFIGYAIMNTGVDEGGASHVNLSTTDYYDRYDRNDKEHKTNRLISELMYSADLTNICLINMKVKPSDINRLLENEKCQKIERVRVINDNRKVDYYGMARGFDDFF